MKFNLTVVSRVAFLLAAVSLLISGTVGANPLESLNTFYQASIDEDLDAYISIQDENFLDAQEADARAYFEASFNEADFLSYQIVDPAVSEEGDMALIFYRLKGEFEIDGARDAVDNDMVAFLWKYDDWKVRWTITRTLYEQKIAIGLIMDAAVEEMLDELNSQSLQDNLIEQGFEIEIVEGEGIPDAPAVESSSGVSANSATIKSVTDDREGVHVQRSFPAEDAGLKSDQQPVMTNQARAPVSLSTEGIEKSELPEITGNSENGYSKTLNAAISGFNNKHLKGVSPEECARACDDETSFECKSFDYYKNSNECDLSSKNASDVGGLKTNYSGNPYDHYSKTPVPAAITAQTSLPTTLIPASENVCTCEDWDKDGRYGLVLNGKVLRSNIGSQTKCAEYASTVSKCIGASALPVPTAMPTPKSGIASNGYSKTFNAAISGFNNKHLKGVSPEECARACDDETSFECKSFDYYKNYNECDLSSKNASDVGGLKTNYSGNPYDHYSKIPVPAAKPTQTSLPTTLIPASENVCTCEDWDKDGRYGLVLNGKVLRSNIGSQTKCAEYASTVSKCRGGASPLSDSLTLNESNASEYEFFSNHNSGAVQNLQHLQTTTFTLTRSMFVTRIETYHWNYGEGKPPGSVGIKGVGVWQATGSPGMHNTPNAYWTVHPSIRLEAGTYAITDSDPATWSQNSGSGGFGFVRIFGRPSGTASTTSIPTAKPTQTPLPTTLIPASENVCTCEDWDKDGRYGLVLNGRVLKSNIGSQTKCAEYANTVSKCTGAAPLPVPSAISQISHSGVTGKIEAGKKVKVASKEISTNGGSIIIEEGSAIHGLELSIPPDSYTQSKRFEISYASVKDHSFGDAFNPVTPLISIDNGGEFSEKMMKITIPVAVPDDYFAMGFLYDEETQKLEGMPLIARGDNFITLGTRHFTDMIVSMIPYAELKKDIDTGFRPGMDDWQFTNRGSYAAPRGHCAGQCLTALWYYINQPDGADLALYGRYDNNGEKPASPDFWYDDSLGYRFASTIQHDINWASFENNFWLNLVGVDDQTTWYLFAYSMQLTGEPQEVGIFSKAGGGHAMICYRIYQGNMYIADPNYPGDIERRIEFVEGTFKPYNSGANAEDIAAGNGKAYEKIGYCAKTTTINWGTIAQRWKEFKEGTVGNTVFPDDYDILYKNTEGKYETVPEELIWSEDKIMLTVESPLGNMGLGVYRDGTLVRPDTTRAFPLEDGDNVLGLYIAGKLNKKWKYLDFKYITITYNELSIEPESLNSKPDEYLEYEAIHTTPPENVHFDWYVDGKIQQRDGGPSFRTSFSKPGEYAISVKMMDKNEKNVHEAGAVAVIEEIRYTPAEANNLMVLQKFKYIAGDISGSFKVEIVSPGSSKSKTSYNTYPFPAIDWESDPRSREIEWNGTAFSGSYTNDNGSRRISGEAAEDGSQINHIEYIDNYSTTNVDGYTTTVEQRISLKNIPIHSANLAIERDSFRVPVRDGLREMLTELYYYEKVTKNGEFRESRTITSPDWSAKGHFNQPHLHLVFSKSAH